MPPLNLFTNKVRIIIPAYRHGRDYTLKSAFMLNFKVTIPANPRD